MENVKPYDVFVSYRRADAPVAQALTRLLRAFEQRVFLDLDSIMLGMSWDETIRQAAGEVSTLLVLWSRNAANSSYMQSELRFVRDSCHIVPVLLDGSALPPELARHEALGGLQAHERLISRVTELVRVEHKSQRAAVEQVVEELKKDGIELTQEQRSALGLFVQALGGLGLLASLITQLRNALQRTTHAAVSKQGVAVAMGVGIAFFGGRLAAAPSSPETTNAAAIACPAADDPSSGDTQAEPQPDTTTEDLAAAQKRIKSLRIQLANQKDEIKKHEESIKTLTMERDRAQVIGARAQSDLAATNNAIRERDIEIVKLRQNQCKPVPQLH